MLTKGKKIYQQDYNLKHICTKHSCISLKTKTKPPLDLKLQADTNTVIVGELQSHLNKN